MLKRSGQASTKSRCARLWQVPAATLALAFATTQSNAVLAQGGPANQMPAFEDPSFRDKVWEAGGPKFYSSRSGKLILSVTIEGEKTVSEHKILSHMQSRANRIFDPDQFNRDLHELYNTDLFSKIEPFFATVPEGIHLKLKIVENPIVRSIVFHGNRGLDEGALKKHAGIEIGDPINPASVRQSESRLMDLYRDKGFANADVKLVSGGRPGETDIIYRISEGELERIDKILFVGNSAFSSELLKAKIKLRDSRYGVTKYMFNAADRDAMHEDQQTLETYYRRLGYFDAKVDHFIEYDEDGKFITLTFAVSEGKQYFINELMVRGNKYHTDEELLAAVKIQPGEAYNQDRADRDTKFIRDIYGAQGFIFCEVTPTIIYLPQNRVNLLFEVSEGDVYVASDIRVHIDGDNSYTKERVALSMIGNLRPGRVIDSREIEAAERRLQFSQIFETNPQVGSPPRIDVQPSNDDEPKR